MAGTTSIDPRSQPATQHVARQFGSVSEDFASAAIEGVDPSLVRVRMDATTDNLQLYAHPAAMPQIKQNLVRWFREVMAPEHLDADAANELTDAQVAAMFDFEYRGAIDRYSGWDLSWFTASAVISMVLKFPGNTPRDSWFLPSEATISGYAEPLADYYQLPVAQPRYDERHGLFVTVLSMDNSLEFLAVELEDVIEHLGQTVPAFREEYIDLIEYYWATHGSDGPLRSGWKQRVGVEDASRRIVPMFSQLPAQSSDERVINSDDALELASARVRLYRDLRKTKEDISDTTSSEFWSDPDTWNIVDHRLPLTQPQVVETEVQADSDCFCPNAERAAKLTGEDAAANPTFEAAFAPPRPSGKIGFCLR